MSSVARGGEITLQAQFYEFAGGSPADATNVSLSIIANGVVLATYTEPTIQHTGTGSYQYTYTVPVDATLGTYTAKWTGTINGSESTGYEYFDVVSAGSVEAGTSAIYVTVDDVLDITGKAVDTTSLRAAQHVIEMYVNRTDSTHMKAKDLHWLSLAVAYQAVYMDEHPELFTTLDVAALSQGDISVTYRESIVDAHVAPLARMAIRRLSWMRTRSIQTESHFTKAADEVDTGNWQAI